MPMVRPRALRRGDTVAVLSPAGPLAAKRRPDLDRGLERLKSWGLKPVLSPHALEVDGYLAGSDRDRLADLQGALDDPGVRGVFCVRGGYGCTRLLPGIDWSGFRDSPKPIVGYSDVTALLAAAHAEVDGMVGFHGPMVATSKGFAMGDAAAEAQRRLLFDAKAAPALPLPEGDVAHVLVAGRAKGTLVGGNLSLVAALCGTRWAVRGAGAIVFLEDIDESPYSVDRMLTQLVQAGTFDGARGIVLGDFRFDDMRGDAMRRALTPVFRSCLDPLGLPMAFGFPFGHRGTAWTLPVGCNAQLDASKPAAPATLRLLEPAVS